MKTIRTLKEQLDAMPYDTNSSYNLINIIKGNASCAVDQALDYEDSVAAHHENVHDTIREHKLLEPDLYEELKPPFLQSEIARLYFAEVERLIALKDEWEELTDVKTYEISL